MKRRRFLAITAAIGALAATPARAFRLDPVEWRGTALGAAASLTLHHEDRAEAERLLAASLAELERLERIFSLYREDSTLTFLNRTGRLGQPPGELLALLSEVNHLWHVSEGIFDPTVQPLWDAYARFFATPAASPPLPDLLPLVGWEKVAISEDAIWFRQPGMAVTLNGIAQGYITDRIADLLRTHGMRHVLVNLGEIRALGPRGDGLPWTAMLNGNVHELQDGALAVSSADATRFSATCHHLFDPRTGRSATNTIPVAVTAPTATIADGLSTACAIAFSRKEDIAARAGGRLLV